jgi:hypothetical protein
VEGVFRDRGIKIKERQEEKGHRQRERLRDNESNRDRNR